MSLSPFGLAFVGAVGGVVSNSVVYVGCSAVARSLGGPSVGPDRSLTSRSSQVSSRHVRCFWTIEKHELTR